MKTAEYMDLPYHFVLVPETAEGETGWIAAVQEFDGCLSQGETPAEAMENIREAMELWINTVIDEGEEPPLPRSEPAHSGQFRLRVPSGLHARLAAEAERQGVSMNTLATALLASGLGWRTSDEPQTSERRQAS